MPTACELNINNVPVSPSVPAGTDKVLFTLLDGTSVLRSWSNVLSALSAVPNDQEYVTLASGSNNNNFIDNNSTVILSTFIGRRIRVYRGSVPQSALQGQFTWTANTGTLTVTPAPVTPEIWQIQAY